MSLIYPNTKQDEKKSTDAEFMKYAKIEMVKAPQTVLLLGSGGRECAMAAAIAESKLLRKLYIAPGNAGTATYGTNVPDLNPAKHEAVSEFIATHDVTLLVCGPEAPLVDGLVDYLQEDARHPDLLVVGPDKAGAHLEGSKEYSKEFMRRHSIPTASYETFGPQDIEEAEEFLDQLSAPFVLKADGLAAGKGVLICQDREEAEQGLRQLFDGMFGSRGQRIVIEEYLEGIECSVFVATDGTDYCVLPVAKDYKRVGDGDTGPNTGGMGAVSPVPFADDIFMQRVEERIIRPTLEGLQEDGIRYVGFLFIGLMNVDGDPHVIEYNCRLGDPETEVVLPRIESDFLELLLAMATGQVAGYDLEVSPEVAMTLVLVSKGYPGHYDKGFPIQLPEPAEGIRIYHSGTAHDEEGRVVTNGGRVLAITARGTTIQEAQEACYRTATQTLYEGKNYRHDIGDDLL